MGDDPKTQPPGSPDFGRAWVLHADYLKVLARIAVCTKYRHLRGKLDLSGIVQDVFVAAMEAQAGPAALRGDDVLPWLRAILKNSLANQIKALHAAKRRMDLAVSLEAAIDESSSSFHGWAERSSATPSKVLMAGERALRFARALCELPERQQEVIILRNLEGRPLRAVAQLLETTPAAVLGLQRRGLAALRRKLEPLLEE